MEERIEAICDSVRRFARYEPDCVLCLTGAAGDRSEDEARALVDRRAAADRCRQPHEAGVRLGLEPIHVSERDGPDDRHVDPGGARPARRGRPPTWESWWTSGTSGDTPNVEQDLRENVTRVTGVHVADWFGGGRGDRALPGEGVSRTAELMRVLHDAGWRGAWDVEIFGDPERADSLWSLDVDGRDNAPTRRSAPPSPEPGARSPRTPPTRCPDRRGGYGGARRAAQQVTRSRQRRGTGRSGH